MAKKAAHPGRKGQIWRPADKHGEGKGPRLAEGLQARRRPRQGWPACACGRRTRWPPKKLGLASVRVKEAEAEVIKQGQAQAGPPRAARPRPQVAIEKRRPWRRIHGGARARSPSRPAARSERPRREVKVKEAWRSGGRAAGRRPGGSRSERQGVAEAVGDPARSCWPRPSGLAEKGMALHERRRTSAGKAHEEFRLQLAERERDVQLAADPPHAEDHGGGPGQACWPRRFEPRQVQHR